MADEASEIAEIRAEMHLSNRDWRRSKPSRRTLSPLPHPLRPPWPHQLRPKLPLRPSRFLPRLKIDTTGFSFASADGSDFIRLHGLVQLDARGYLDDAPISNNDGFLIRRARLIFEGGLRRDLQLQLGSGIRRRKADRLFQRPGHLRRKPWSRAQFCPEIHGRQVQEPHRPGNAAE